LDALAGLAESTGIESIWVSEHPVVADPRRPPSPMNPEDPILDPVTALAFLAAKTRSVRLGSGVIVLPLHPPLLLAKELATVDVLSGGRLIFGVGVGYVPDEFAALGVPFLERGRRTEEYLGAILAIWTQPRPSWGGSVAAFAGVQAHPRPAQRPHPPVVMGGYAPAVMARVVREADGWYGWGLEPDAVRPYLTALAEAGERERRRDGLGRVEITVTPPGDVDVRGAEGYAAIGVDRLNLMLPWSADGPRLSVFFEEVVGPLVDAM